MPHNVLSTVSDHCTSRFGGKQRLPRPLMCAVPPCDYKRRRRATGRRALTLSYALSLSLGGHSNTHRRDPSSPTLRHPYSPRSTPLLTETWEPSSLSRLAGTPYYEHVGCKIIQCPRTPPLLDVRPRGRNQDIPCVTVLPLASSSGTKKHVAFTSWDPGPRVGTPTHCIREQYANYKCKGLIIN